MVLRRFAFSFCPLLLACFVGLTFPIGADEPKKDDPSKKETKKDDSPKKESSKKEEAKKNDTKKEEKKDEPKKEPYVPDAPVKEWKGHDNWINAMVISGNGKTMATASRDRTLKIWDLASGKELAVLKGSPDNIKGLVFLESSAKIASTAGKWNKEKKAWEGEIKIWDAKTGKEIRSIKGHSDPIESLALSKDGKFLASAGDDQTVKIWDLASGKDIQTLKGHTGVIHAVVFSSDGKKLATAGDDKTVKIWDSASGKELANFKIEPPVMKVDPAKKEAEKKDNPKKDDSKKEEKKEEPKKKDAPKKDAKKVEPKDLARPFTTVVFSPDDRKLYAGNLDGFIKFYDVETAKEIGELKTLDGIWALAISPDGSKLATGGWDKTVKVWDSGTKKELFTIKAHNDTVTALVFINNGQQILSASNDGQVKIWNADLPPPSRK